MSSMFPPPLPPAPSTSAPREILEERKQFWEEFYNKWSQFDSALADADSSSSHPVSDEEDWSPAHHSRRERLKRGLPEPSRMRSRAFGKYVREAMRRDEEIQSILSSPNLDADCAEGTVEDIEIDDEDDSEDEDEEQDEQQQETILSCEQREALARINLTGDIFEPLSRFRLDDSSPTSPLGDPMTLTSATLRADDEVCSVLTMVVSNANNDDKENKTPEKKGMDDARGGEGDAPVPRAESPFYKPSQHRKKQESMCLDVSPDRAEEPLMPLNRRSLNVSSAKEALFQEEEQEETCEPEFLNDEVGVLSPSALAEVSSLPPEVFVAPLDCALCGAPAFLPDTYWEDMPDEEPFPCDRCLAARSGHLDCSASECAACVELAGELTRRAIIRKNYVEGTLRIEIEEEEE